MGRQAGLRRQTRLVVAHRRTSSEQLRRVGKENMPAAVEQSFVTGVVDESLLSPLRGIINAECSGRRWRERGAPMPKACQVLRSVDRIVLMKD